MRETDRQTGRQRQRDTETQREREGGGREKEGVGGLGGAAFGRGCGYVGIKSRCLRQLKPWQTSLSGYRIEKNKIMPFRERKLFSVPDEGFSPTAC